MVFGGQHDTFIISVFRGIYQGALQSDCVMLFGLGLVTTQAGGFRMRLLWGLVGGVRGRGSTSQYNGLK